ncbi:PQQ-like beta-propeller repeat protein [bacterium]|nr:PQQ-like beta-propeller repeat protein [bacterium]
MKIKFTLILIMTWLAQSFAQAGTVKWTYEIEGGISSPAISANGTIYFVSSDHNVYALNPDGSLKWNFETEKGFAARRQLARMVQYISIVTVVNCAR